MGSNTQKKNKCKNNNVSDHRKFRELKGCCKIALNIFGLKTE